MIASIWRNRNGSQLFDFVRLGIAIARRAALDDVGDVHVLARQADRLDDLGQQLAGAADERLALLVLVRARRLADEHQVGVRVADAEHDLLAAQRVQLAARARRADLVLEQREQATSVPPATSVAGSGRSPLEPPRCQRAEVPERGRRSPRTDVADGSRSAPRHGWRQAGSRLTPVDAELLDRSGDGRARSRDIEVAWRAAARRDRESRAATAVLLCSGTSSTPSRETSVTALVSTSNPTPGCDTSLATIRSTRLALELLARVLEHVVRLGGKADEHRPIRRVRDGSASEVGQDVLRARQRQVQRPSLLGDLLRRARRRRVVGHGRRHDDDVRAGARASTASCISAALRTGTISSTRGGSSTASGR